MFKHILIPTDGSDVAAKAIHAGVALAKEMGARVTGFYAEEPRPMHLHNKGYRIEKELVAEFDRRSREYAERSVAKIEDVRGAGLESLGIMRDAGLAMAFGTDLLGETHSRQSEEFTIRARVLNSRSILAGATTVAARLIGYEGRLGVVAPGAIADLLVVDGNPLENVGLLAQPERYVRAVVQAGRLHRNSLS